MKVKKSLVFVLALTGLIQSAASFAVGPDGRPDGRDGRADGHHAGGGRFGGRGDDRVVVGAGVPMGGGGRTVVVTHHDGSGFRPPAVEVRHDGRFGHGGGYDPRYPGYPIYPGGPVVVPPHHGGGSWGDRPGFDYRHGGGGRWERPFAYDRDCRHDFDFSGWERRGYRMTTMTCVAVPRDQSGRRFPYTDVQDGFRDRMSDIQDAALDLCYEATGYSYRGACVIEDCTPGYERRRW